MPLKIDDAGDCTIYFLYRGNDGWCSRRARLSEAEGEIRYWLGKSPGIHEMEEILVVSDDQKGHWAEIQTQVQAELFAAHAAIQDKQERETYERLKKKFGP